MQLEQFEQHYLRHLNAQQRQAVLSVDGNILLLATPGSGKTTVLVTRLGYMICCKGIDPASILTMTYTVAATRDMTERFASLFGQETAQSPPFGTINSLSLGVISYFGKMNGRQAFETLSDDAEINRIIRQIYQRHNDDYPEDSVIRDIRTKISYIKNMMLSEDEISGTDWKIDHLPEIYSGYQNALRKSRRMDFDDQVVYALNILQKYPAVLSYYQDQYPFICIDEAQDTSKIQHEIIKLLAAKHGNLFMVGDEDQSIYGFRAAYPEALLQFEKDHPGATVLLMEENYRSTGEIVDVANRFVSQNLFRHEKTIVPTRDAGNPVHVVHCQNREDQIYYLQEIARTCDRQTAVLYRNNDSALPLIDLFEQERIPYNCRKSEDQFFASRMLTDIRDIIKFSYEPNNGELFMRVFYKFGTPISKTVAQVAVDRSRRSNKPILEELLKAPDLRGFARDNVIDLLQSSSMIQSDNAEIAIHRIWNDMHYRRYADQKKLDPGKYYILCILARDVATPLALLEKLDSLRDTINNHTNSINNKIILSTVHSSKGLEYERVYLVDILDGILPAKPEDAVQTPDEAQIYEEERRLFYVAMTRAMDELYLFRCSEPSVFTSEIMEYLPTRTIEDDDFVASFLRPQIGKRFMDREYGNGRILAQCENRFLIKFQNEALRLLSLEEMLTRYNPQSLTKARKANRSQTPSRLLLGPWQVLMTRQLMDSIKVGGVVRYKSFGNGVVKSLENGILTVEFQRVGEKKLLLKAAISSGLLQ